MAYKELDVPKGQVPFLGDEMLHTSAGMWYLEDEPKVTNHPMEEFTADLVLVAVTTGRSRTTFHMLNRLDGRKYVMNLSQLHSCLPLDMGLRGRFRYLKQGESFTIAPVRLDNHN